MKEYILDRYRDGKLMAEGAKVRAASLQDAIDKARELFRFDREYPFAFDQGYKQDTFQERLK